MPAVDSPYPGFIDAPVYQPHVCAHAPARRRYCLSCCSCADMLKSERQSSDPPRGRGRQRLQFPNNAHRTKGHVGVANCSEAEIMGDHIEAAGATVPLLEGDKDK